MDETEVFNIADQQQNKNTAKKSFYDIVLFKRFVTVKKETREIHNIQYSEFDPLIANFLLTVKKTDATEYEPSTLRGYISSIDIHLRRHKYGHAHSITGNKNDDSFNLTRQTLNAKQEVLKQKGKVNKPKRSQPITNNEINMLYEKGLLGDSSPESLLNTVWVNNCIQFGLRGVSEHYNLRWGDVTLNTDSNGVQYLELNERQTNARTRTNISDVREVSPKIFENPGDRDPIKFYEMYASKRPSIFFSGQEDPFYLAPRTIPLEYTRSSLWYLRQKVGVKKLGKLLKTMKKRD